MTKFTQYLLIALMAMTSVGSANEDAYGHFAAAIYSDELKLDLYYKVGCPYCQKVIRYLNRTGIAINFKDIKRDLGLREELMEIGGKTQVPCLVINGEPM